MGVSLTTVVNGIGNSLDGMIKRQNALRSYLNSNVYRQYQNAQRKRWMTQNNSEGDQWKPLNPDYAKRKLKKFADYDGAGTKQLVGTGRLVQSVVGPSTDHRKLVTNRSIEIATVVPYGKYVSDIRPFMTFGDETIEKIVLGIMKFLVKNRLGIDL